VKSGKVESAEDEDFFTGWDVSSRSDYVKANPSELLTSPSAPKARAKAADY